MPKQATKIVIGGKHVNDCNFHEMWHTTRGVAWLKCNVRNCGEKCFEYTVSRDE